METSLAGSSPARTRQVLSQWFADREIGAMIFSEDTDPGVDPDSSYQLAYKATFDPPSLEQAQVEVWVTVEGEIAIGIERFGRIADRLGVGCSLNQRQVFAAGHEPLVVSDSGLLGLLDLIADGKLAISVTLAPLVGLLGAVAVLPDGALDPLVSAGYSSKARLRERRNARPRSWRRLIQYDRW